MDSLAGLLSQSAHERTRQASDGCVRVLAMADSPTIRASSGSRSSRTGRVMCGLRACLAIGAVAALLAGCGGSSKPTASKVASVCPRAARTAKALKIELASFQKDASNSVTSLGADAQAVADSIDQLAADAGQLGYPALESKLKKFASDLTHLGKDADKLDVKGLSRDAQTLQSDEDGLSSVEGPSSHVCKAFKSLADVGSS